MAGIIAAQLGVNVELAKCGTMLHDIVGIDFERESTYDYRKEFVSSGESRSSKLYYGSS